MHSSATPYSSLPAMPTINAMPYGIPRGPWDHLYRSAPGAQIPAVRYPGMRGAGFGSAMMGALGDVPGVTIQGFGAEATNGNGTAKISGLLIGALFAAGYGAGLAMAITSGNPIRNSALLSGGVTLGAGLLSMAMTKKSATAPAA